MISNVLARRYRKDSLKVHNIIYKYRGIHDVLENIHLSSAITAIGSGCLIPVLTYGCGSSTALSIRSSPTGGASALLRCRSCSAGCAGARGGAARGAAPPLRSCGS